MKKKKKKVTISIKGLPAFFDVSDEDGFELMTDGEYLRENGVTTFSYIESELTGNSGTKTTFNVEPDRVILHRGGTYGEDMIFSEKQRHHFLYETPFGSVTMGIDTHSITKNMRDDSGDLEIRYDIKVDNVAVSQNLLKIGIRTPPQ
jgi:uncharacterized beta-barrel protein YwiB (DUF1934 family)